MINVQHREPDPQELIGIARRFGTIMVARAYADWTRQPEFFKGSLMAAMIDRVDCPAKVRERFRQNNGVPYNPQGSFYDRHDAQQADDESYADDDGDEANSEQPMDIYRDEPMESAEDDAEYADEDSPQDEREISLEHDGESDDMDDGDEEGDDQPERLDPGYNYSNGNGNSNGNGGNFYQPQQQIITQSTVDLNMLMDMIETVFDR